MRFLVALLLLLLVVLQYRLWVGEGSLADVYNLKQEINEQKQALLRLEQRNGALQAEVSDLKRGLEAIEERARSELGMIKDNEVFYQVTAPGTPKE
ncbi:MAG: cell division protein FtsB [Chromatiaceae bacterium]|nr:cell division protein FtsB [Gammaproteobacteria bacterium]MCB1872740.1 cell division protein FtsB [Gammaproteobacteria bacterium]MCB1878509.1 cell division protein FtsB [Gammaproteobacteria bacterium]MCP5448160.1 cell division protein FtsB [Chromatiaceae bacterium]